MSVEGIEAGGAGEASAIGGILMAPSTAGIGADIEAGPIEGGRLGCGGRAAKRDGGDTGDNKPLHEIALIKSAKLVPFRINRSPVEDHQPAVQKGLKTSSNPKRERCLVMSVFGPSRHFAATRQISASVEDVEPDFYEHTAAGTRELKMSK
jgi:hypothetical protein